MSVFVNDTDGRRSAIRTWYYTWLGREIESEQAMQGWLGVWSSHGGEAVLFSIYDSGEAKVLRTKRGW